MLKVNGYGGRQAKVNEKSLCFKGWETLVSILLKICSHGMRCLGDHSLPFGGEGWEGLFLVFISCAYNYSMNILSFLIFFI